MTGSAPTRSPEVMVSTRSVNTAFPSTARWSVSMVRLWHMAKKPPMKAMVSSIPTAGSIGMLWYTTSSVKNGRSASASCLANAAHMDRTTCSASSAAPMTYLPGSANHDHDSDAPRSEPPPCGERAGTVARTVISATAASPGWLDTSGRCRRSGRSRICRIGDRCSGPVLSSIIPFWSSGRRHVGLGTVPTGGSSAPTAWPGPGRQPWVDPAPDPARRSGRTTGPPGRRLRPSRPQNPALRGGQKPGPDQSPATDLPGPSTVLGQARSPVAPRRDHARWQMVCDGHGGDGPCRDHHRIGGPGRGNRSGRGTCGDRPAFGRHPLGLDQIRPESPRYRGRPLRELILTGHLGMGVARTRRPPVRSAARLWWSGLRRHRERHRLCPCRQHGRALVVQPPGDPGGGLGTALR